MDHGRAAAAVWPDAVNRAEEASLFASRFGSVGCLLWALKQVDSAARGFCHVAFARIFPCVQRPDEKTFKLANRSNVLKQKKFASRAGSALEALSGLRARMAEEMQPLSSLITLITPQPAQETPMTAVARSHPSPRTVARGIKVPGSSVRVVRKAEPEPAPEISPQSVQDPLKQPAGPSTSHGFDLVSTPVTVGGVRFVERRLTGEEVEERRRLALELSQAAEEVAAARAAQEAATAKAVEEAAEARQRAFVAEVRSDALGRSQRAQEACRQVRVQRANMLRAMGVLPDWADLGVEMTEEELLAHVQFVQLQALRRLILSGSARVWREHGFMHRRGLFAASFIARRRVEWTFDAWVTRWDERDHQQKRNQTAAEIIAKGRMALAWEAWVQSIVYTVDQASKTLLIWKLMRGPRGHAVDRWLKQAQSDGRLRKASTGVVRRRLADAWPSWCTFVREKVVRLQLLARKRDSRLSPWRSWQLYAVEIRQQNRREAAANDIRRRQAWSSWIACVLEQEAAKRYDVWKEHRRVAEASKRRLALQTWTVYLAEQANLRRAAFVAQRSRVAHIWADWRTAAKEAAAQKAKLTRALGKMRDLRAPAWASWLEYRSNLLRLRAAAMRILNQRLSSGWSSWCSYVVEKKEYDATMSRSLAGLRDKRPAALRSWLEHLEERSKLRRAACRIANARVAAAWTAWLSANEEAAEQKMKLKRAASRLADARAPAWASWVARASEEADRMTKLRRACSRLQNGSRARAWAGWMAFVDDQAKMRIVGTKMLHMQLNLAWSAWWLYLAEKDEEDQQATRIGARMLDQRFPAFSTWIEYCASLRKAFQAASRMANARVAAAWMAWLLANEEAAEQKMKLKRAASKLTDRRAPAWATWLEYAEQSMRLKRAASKLADRRAPAWATWIERVEEKRRLKRAASRLTDARAPAWASWLEHNSNLLKIRSAALRVLNQRLAGGWSSWCDYLGDQAEQATLMAKLRIAAMKILDGRSAKALATWMELVAERAKMRTIVTRMVHVRMANGLSGWCTYASERNAAREKTRKACSRISDPRVPAFNSWSEYCKDCLCLRRAASRILNRRVSSAWESWATAVSEASAHAAMLERASSKFSPMYPAWRAWLGMRSNLLRLRTAAMRILNQRLSSGWSSWSGYVEEKKEHKAALARTLAGLSDKRMPAWRAWTQSVEEARAMRACLSGAIDYCRRQAWNTWSTTVSEQAAAHAKLRHAATKLLDGARNRAFLSWMGLVAERTKMRGVASRMMNMRLSRSWSGWCTYLEEKAAAMEQISRATARIADKRVPALNTWIEYCEGCRKALHAVGRIANRHLACGWESWMSLVRDAAERSEKMLSVWKRLRGPRGLALDKWLKYRASLLRMREAAAGVFNRRLATAWSTWREYVSEQEALRSRSLPSAADGYHRHHALLKCWRTWQQCLSASRKMETVSAQVYTVRLRREWATWRLRAADEAAALKAAEEVAMKKAAEDMAARKKAAEEAAAAKAAAAIKAAERRQQRRRQRRRRQRRFTRRLQWRM